jgi:glycosyltransferase involved in cell wall biosynthesis
LRILRLITRLNAGGPARHVVWANQGLARRGHETLLAFGGVEPGEDDISVMARKAGVALAEIPGLRRSPGVGADAAALAGLLRLIRSFRPDVLHTHTAKAGTLGRIAALPARALPGRNRPRVFHTFHGHTLTGYFSPAFSLAMRVIEGALARYPTDRIVALSPLQKTELVRLLRLDPSRIVVIPNALELSEYDSLPPRGTFRRELGIPENRTLWGAIGRIAPVKNYSLLFEVSRSLAARLGAHAPVVVVVGGGDGLEEFRDRARREGLADSLIFCGPRFDLPQIYSDLDGVVLCSNQEGTPLCLIEAMVCGLPVVATAVGGVPDLLTRTFEGPLRSRIYRDLAEPRGSLVAAGDAAGLAEALSRRPSKRPPEGRTSPFRLERLLDDYEALYTGPG